MKLWIIKRIITIQSCKFRNRNHKKHQEKITTTNKIKLYIQGWHSWIINDRVGIDMLLSQIYLPFYTKTSFFTLPIVHWGAPFTSLLVPFFLPRTLNNFPGGRSLTSHSGHSSNITIVGFLWKLDPSFSYIQRRKIDPFARNVFTFIFLLRLHHRHHYQLPSVFLL